MEAKNRNLSLIKHRSMRVLCVYATRQIDSNLFMSSTIFNGLKRCGYDVDMLFWGYETVCDVFRARYSKYFCKVFYHTINESHLSRLSKKSSRLHILYSFLRCFLGDYVKRPYRIEDFSIEVHNDYDVILSFIPPVVSGFLANDIKESYCKNARLIQFWTDPLSLGRCNSISEIPKTRMLHVIIEKRLLSFADKIVFCYPLLCEKEKELHPESAKKMTWSDVGYTEHRDSSINLRKDNCISIGLFGSYHSKVRNIHPFLEAIKAYNDIRFVLRGDSDISVDPSLYPNLDFVAGRRPVDEIEEEEANCDILVCLGGKSGITHPAGKVFYYADYNKPIIYIGDGKHNDYFKEYLAGFGRYIICDNEIKSIQSAIQKAISVLPDFVLTIPKRLEPDVIARRIVEE